MKIVNLIATYNEKENITPMLESLKSIAQNNPQWQFQTLIVDDDSPDGTGQIVKKWMKKDNSVILLSGKKKGLGHALLKGYKHAINTLKADVIVSNDCDFSWNPKRTPDLLKKIDEGWDVVIGSRHKPGGTTKGWSLFRKINHWISNFFFATLVAGINQVKDHNGNFKAIRVKNVLDKVPLDNLFKKLKVWGFAFQPYILYELSLITDKFFEVPVAFKFRTLGEAKIGRKYLKSYFKDVVEYIKLCFLIRLKKLKKA